MSTSEIPFFFDCQGASLLAVASVPAQPKPLGVVIVVGGPQYRVGSHRQFLLLARSLAEKGYACLRFDYRGMGDSDGPRVGFEAIGADIAAAIDGLQRNAPSVTSVVLWGHCDGAAAAALGANGDRRVRGLALFNPWVRTDEVAAQARLKSYYVSRVLSRAFWKKLLSGKLGYTSSLRSFADNVRRATSRSAAPAPSGTLPERVGIALRDSRVPVLLGLSKRDAVAAEFRLVSSRPGPLDEFRRQDRTTEIEFEADHTFSCKAWRDAAADATLDWISREFGMA